ncbi:MAG: electron transfer flavoprotein beta subunit [Alphaproteobacteria bacterium]|jgi:electron transfer flavoprotein beta subunit
MRTLLVPVKRVLDYNVKPRIKIDGSGVDLSNVKMSLNPFDEIAVEEAIRLKEKSLIDEIIIVSIGVAQAKDTIRTALAMGADKGIHIVTDEMLEPLSVAKILQKIAQEINPELIIMGKQAIDDDYNQTGQMLAALMDRPQATFASKLEFIDDKVHITREIDGGLQTIAINKPAIITTDLRLNEPRYASLPNIMKAKSKPITERPITEFDVDIKPRFTITNVSEPKPRLAGIKVESVDEFIAELKQLGGLA